VIVEGVFSTSFGLEKDSDLRAPYPKRSSHFKTLRCVEKSAENRGNSQRARPAGF
jgi:hypothetical protein